MVKSFQLQKSGYPINVSRKKHLLKLSNKSDDEIKEMKKKTMNAEMTRRIAQSRKQVVRYNKGYNKPTPLCYVENDDDDHNLV